MFDRLVRRPQSMRLEGILARALSAAPASRTLGLLSPDLWTDSEPRRPVRMRGSPGLGASPTTVPRHDDASALPDSVVAMFRDGLDAGGLQFVKYGPRTPAERLAFAQEIGPDVHIRAMPAAQTAQAEFQATGAVDQSQYFAGPDGRLYSRAAGLEEPLAARIRRGMERAIGGFPSRTVAQNLADLQGYSGGSGEDVLTGDAGADDLDEAWLDDDSYDQATRDKIADVQAYDPPLSDEQRWTRDFLRAQRVNPATWRLAEPLPDDAQQTFRENGYQVWWAIAPFAFAGPDGILYRHNEYTREDPLSANYRILDWQERQARKADEPPPDPWEVYWQAVASGQFLPGAGNARVPWRTTQQQARPITPIEPVPAPTRLRGRYGNAKTRDQNNRIGVGLEGTGWEQTGGLPRKGREDLREEHIPNPAKKLDPEADGRQGSIYPDLTFNLPDGRMARVQTMTVNPETNKATLQELDTLLRIRNRVGGDVYGILKTHQLRNRNRDRSN